MVKKEYNNTNYSVKQIERAIDMILADHKSDFKLEGYYTDAALIRCRNGYSWNLLAEIMWDKVDTGHNDIVIECRNDEDPAAVKLQPVDIQKHMDHIDSLFMKYVRMPEPPPPPAVKRNFSKARNILIAAIICAAAIGGIIFYLMES